MIASVEEGSLQTLLEEATGREYFVGNEALARFCELEHKAVCEILKKCGALNGLFK